MKEFVSSYPCWDGEQSQGMYSVNHSVVSGKVQLPAWLFDLTAWEKEFCQLKNACEAGDVAGQ